jgi:pre-mRNA-processing factor 17
MDNSIVVYMCGEKVKKMGRKVFRGHTNIGYACQIGFSPNSKFIMSGDSSGKLHVWDWKTAKVSRFICPSPPPY